MPITTQVHELERYNGDEDHWGHVMETIFVKAILPETTLRLAQHRG